MDTMLIKVVISTLNDVEVRGKDNLDRLLGCINALESLVLAAESPSGSHVKQVREEESNG